MGSQDNLTTYLQDVELVQLRGQEGGETVLAPDTSWRGWARRRLGLLLVVVAPTFVTAFYLFLLAAPRYESAAEFVVRIPGNGQASQIANMISGSSVIRSVDDGYVVAAYIKSRDAMRQVVRKDGFRNMLEDTGLDPLWRYPFWFTSDTEERLYSYYKSLVNVSYDQTTGIITLRAQGFRPKDAQRLVQALLRHSEELINTMNDRAQADAIRVAEAEVDQAKDQAYQAADAITAFRDREKIIDPKLVTNAVLKTITDLALTMAQSNAQLSQLRRTSPQSPSIEALKAKIASLNAQIDAEREQLAGRSGSLAPQIAQYDKLLLDQQFAERMFGSALTSLEAARADAMRQRAFIEEIAQPDLPDRPAYPYRILTLLAVIAVFSMIYRICRSLIRDTLEHAIR